MVEWVVEGHVVARGIVQLTIICTLLRKKSGLCSYINRVCPNDSNGDCGILDISDLQTCYLFILFTICTICTLLRKKWSLCSYINRVCPNHSNGDCGILDISDLQTCYFSFFFTTYTICTICTLLRKKSGLCVRTSTESVQTTPMEIVAFLTFISDLQTYYFFNLYDFHNLYDLYIASQKKWSLCSYINRVCPNHSNGDCGILDISDLQICYFFNLYDLYIASQKKWSLCSHTNRVCPNHSNGDCGILDISHLQTCYFLRFHNLYIASQKKSDLCVRTSTESVQTTPMEIVAFLTLVICKHVTFSFFLQFVRFVHCFAKNVVSVFVHQQSLSKLLQWRLWHS